MRSGPFGNDVQYCFGIDVMFPFSNDVMGPFGDDVQYPSGHDVMCPFPGDHPLRASRMVSCIEPSTAVSTRSTLSSLQYSRGCSWAPYVPWHEARTSTAF